MAKDYKINMTEGPIFSKMLLFSVPIIFSGILQMLFNTADTIVIGRFAGEVSLAAVGSTGSITAMFVNVFIGLSVGTNVIVAQGMGSKNDRLIHDTIHTSVLFSLIAGVCLAVLGFFASGYVLKLIDTPQDVIGKASLYLRIIFLGSPFSMLYNYSAAVLRAMGDTRRPMVYLIISGIINVLLNLLLVIFFKMDVAGVAIATIVSQMVSAVLVIRTLTKLDGEYKLDFSKLRIDKKIIFKMMKIGIPSSLGGVIISFSHMTIQSAVNSFGKNVMAGNAAAANLEGFLYLAVNAISQGALNFTAQNYAAGKFDRIKKTVLLSMIMSVTLAVGLSVIFTVFSKEALSLYSESPEVVSKGMIRLIGTFPFYFIYGFADLFAGSLRGLGKSLEPSVTSIMTTCIFRIVWIFLIFPLNPTIEFLYICLPISWLLEALGQSIYFLIVYQKEKKTMVIPKSL